ncbi:MAG: amidohydrolase family protein [Bacteroidota bacterium]
MRKIAATYIFPGNLPPIKNGILVCEEDGTVIDIIKGEDSFREEHGIEFYSGILTPGFVNAHCHLELSHLHGKIGEHEGIGGFIKAINQLRNEETQDIERLLNAIDRKMWASGIAAVGDISNSDISIHTKQKSKIKYHTFVEVFGFHPSRATRAFDYAQMVVDEFQANGLASSVVPHSPYSVSEPLFNKIRKNAETTSRILSIHNQESEAEKQFFIDGTGPISGHLQNNLGIDISHWKPTGESSLQSTLKHLPAENQLLLVHNTFTEKSDIYKLRDQRSVDNTFFVLCPNSNLYIENKLPPVTLFRNENLKICLGTDSLASNRQLSILAEMVTLQENFPEISFEELVSWACIIGAEALKIEKDFGSFEPGKKPGVNLITGIDFQTMRLTSASKVKRLV